MARPRLLPDTFTLALLGAVAIATLLPARGQGVVVFEWITNLAIGLLFFMHGAKLSGSAILAGMGHWRLHLLVFSCTFVLFPLLGLALRSAADADDRRRALPGHALLMRAAGHGAVGHRLHIAGARQYPGGGMQRGGLEPDRHLSRRCWCCC